MNAPGMSDLDKAIAELATANRILAHEGVVDAYGHVSIRHPKDPKRFLLSRSRSPELVKPADIMEFDLDGSVAGGDRRPPYLERFIHAGIYVARPEIVAVVHAHAEETIPFGTTSQPLRPIIHSGANQGAHVPVWDIRENFGDETNLLVANIDQGRDLARRLGDASVVLMRGHGFAAAARSLFEVVKISVYLPRNAQILMDALRLGEARTLSDGEIRAWSNINPDTPESRRAWEYWSRRAKR
jgi:ribulose-5-phosphate 4-epimerase/fuculose-1-phosphate aldolase